MKMAGVWFDHKMMAGAAMMGMIDLQECKNEISVNLKLKMCA